MTTHTDHTHTDHIEISTLISRFFRALDERKFEEGWARDYVTDDVRTETPVGSSEGADVERLTEEALLRYERTQHIASDVIVDVDLGAGRATATWNALMTHAHHESTLRALGEGAAPLFTVGGRYEADLSRTADGWRISRVSVRAIWTAGQPPLGVSG